MPTEQSEAACAGYTHMQAGTTIVSLCWPAGPRVAKAYAKQTSSRKQQGKACCHLAESSSILLRAMSSRTDWCCHSFCLKAVRSSERCVRTKDEGGVGMKCYTLLALHYSVGLIRRSAQQPPTSPSPASAQPHITGFTQLGKQYGPSFAPKTARLDQCAAALPFLYQPHARATSPVQSAPVLALPSQSSACSDAAAQGQAAPAQSQNLAPPLHENPPSTASARHEASSRPQTQDTAAGARLCAACAGRQRRTQLAWSKGMP